MRRHQILLSLPGLPTFDRSPSLVTVFCSSCTSGLAPSFSQGSLRLKATPPNPRHLSWHFLNNNSTYFAFTVCQEYSSAQ